VRTGSSLSRYGDFDFLVVSRGMIIHMTNLGSVGECMSDLTGNPQKDPQIMFHSLDAWRKSLPGMMHMGESAETDVYFLSIQAMSYRFECILCRLIRRRWEGSQNPDWGDWAKKRLRSAIFELDTITKRVLSSGTLLCFPISL